MRKPIATIAFLAGTALASQAYAAETQHVGYVTGTKAGPCFVMVVYETDPQWVDKNTSTLYAIPQTNFAQLSASAEAGRAMDNHLLLHFFTGGTEANPKPDLQCLIDGETTPVTLPQAYRLSQNVFN